VTDPKLDHLATESDRVVDIGDLDQNRNLKIRSFLGLVLTPVFRELTPRLGWTEMGRRGITPGQYFQDFHNEPAPFGYGDRFRGRHEVRLRLSISNEAREPATEPLPVKRLLIETRATLFADAATGRPPAMGFNPPLAGPSQAGTGRVLHVLTRPQNPPGQRWVDQVPEELGFLMLHRFDEPYPTIALLREIEPDFAEIDFGGLSFPGIWSMANTDVFQHVHAREYTTAMENAVGRALAIAGLPLDRYLPTRARVIFRRPGFVGQPYRLALKLFRRDQTLVALGAFHGGRHGTAIPDEQRAAVFMRFEGRLA
jgi:hypothetical protein